MRVDGAIIIGVERVVIRIYILINTIIIINTMK